jgi:hypothetical protein
VGVVSVIRALTALFALLGKVPPEVVAGIVDAVRAMVDGDKQLAARRARWAAGEAAAYATIRETLRRK